VRLSIAEVDGILSTMRILRPVVGDNRPGAILQSAFRTVHFDS
jgi:hypothetical protein